MKNEFIKMVPDVKIISGTAQQLPFPDNSLHVVITAQAFHWFATLEALKEIHRVLVKGGIFAMIWNLEDRNKAIWVAKLRDNYEQYESGTPQYRQEIWRNCFSEDNQTLFSELQETHYAHSFLCTNQTIWERVLSKSYISCQPKDTQAKLKDTVYELLRKELPHLFEKEGNTVEYPYNTDLVITLSK